MTEVVELISAEIAEDTPDDEVKADDAKGKAAARTAASVSLVFVFVYDRRRTSATEHLRVGSG